MGSGVEWLKLVNVKKECCQLYEQYKEEEWAPVNPSLEFLLDNLMAGMTHPVGALVVVRGEEQSKGYDGKEKADHGDIQEGPSTPKAVASRGLATLPRLATTSRSKGKEKGKA
ncbi:hypothetical protein C0989_006639 [Termitomyces sp. Mn162]|nr:hypothetical protein C0989_006639 [Termitomyces sp. Mn162]